MAINLNFNLHGDNGETVDAMRKIIQTRNKELGETTKQSCVAMTINVLKHLRTGTKQPRETERPSLTITDVSEEYYPSWKCNGKGKKNRYRVLRRGKDGNVINEKKVYWLCKDYFKGQKVYTFKVIDSLSETKKYEYLLVSEDQQKAKECAKERHKNRIKRFKGLAKFALGWAMHKVHDAQNPTDEINDNTRAVGLENTYTDIRETGLNSGDIDIHVEDNLEYAEYALKDTNTDIAVAKALNKMVGYINHKLHQKGIKDDLKINLKELEQQ